MNKIAGILFLMTTVAFGGLYFFNPPETLTVEIENPADAKLRSENKRLTTENKILSDKVTALEDQMKRIDTAKKENVSAAVAAVNTNKPKIEKSKTENPFQKMFNDPKVSAMMKKRRTDMVKGRYAYLFKKMNLSEEEQTALVDLLGERFSVGMASRMKMFANKDDAEGKVNAEAERDDAYAEADSKIEDLLGDKYGVYADYNEKKSEYDYVSGLSRSLSDSPLTDEQTDKLAGVLNQNNSDYQFTNEKVNESKWAVYSLDKEERAEHVKELEARDELVLKDTEGFLTEEQQSALKERQVKDRERILKGSRFGRRGGRGR